MSPRETPPSSPSAALQPPQDVEEEEAVELEEADVAEVFDVEPDDDDDNEDAEEDGAEDNSVATLKSHSGSVFCCDFSPDQLLLASGGEDNCLHLHDANTLQIVFDTQDLFKDSVSECVFSSRLVAAGDLSGAVRVFKCDNNDFNQVFQFDTSDITWMRWHPRLPNVLFAATEASELWMWKVSTGDSKLYMGNGEKAESACIVSDGKKVAVGYGDGSMRVFDLKTGSSLHSLASGSSGGHEGAVIHMDASDNGLVASASTDGFAKVFSAQSGRNVALFRGQQQPSTDAEEEGNFQSVEQVLFSPSGNLLITATLEGVLVVWDMATKVARHSLNLTAGVTRLMWRTKDSENDLLLVAKLDGEVDLVDVRLGEIVATCKKHSGPVLSFAVSPDGDRLFTGSDDGTCKIYDLKRQLTERIAGTSGSAEASAMES